MNSTKLSSFDNLPYPFYYVDRPTLIPNLSDEVTSLLCPVIGYWILSLFFHFLDRSGWRALDKYRIHESKEVTSRNLVTPGQVVRAVVLQQVIQTALGFLVLEEQAERVDHAGKMRSLSGTIGNVLAVLVGQKGGMSLLQEKGVEITWFTYWWAIPTAQFFLAIFIMDSWEYFLHRLFHINKFLYKHIHSVHHRLYVPYAFGALYNHPLEGFLLDTAGALVAHAGSFMNTRQAVLLFTISTLKTVDDHCGYKLPWDPLQWFTTNNADYHDIHHQVVGIKSNFSQPFFVHWDVILGTRMTREEVEQRRKKQKSS
ncbi:sphingosine hydroxylase [Rickenella mellea]|uniref:Sphingosine hydroxylase n=1 Tax=Rickenella mellea TaxID=50990 RepID=A0A4Y7Q5S2_9AGAM|nr:sphingosine hydroxylase [Rickenella mellea]